MPRPLIFPWKEAGLRNRVSGSSWLKGLKHKTSFDTARALDSPDSHFSDCPETSPLIAGLSGGLRIPQGLPYEELVCFDQGCQNPDLSKKPTDGNLLGFVPETTGLSECVEISLLAFCHHCLLTEKTNQTNSSLFSPGALWQMAGKVSHLLAQGISLIRLWGPSMSLALSIFSLVKLKANYILRLGSVREVTRCIYCLIALNLP